MVDFEIGPSDTEIEGCLTAIEVRFDNEGELTVDDIEDIDDEMGSIGSQSTGQRIRVNSKPDMPWSSVVYVYQEALQFSTRNQMKFWFDRFEARTRFENPVYKFGTEVVEFRNQNAEEGL